MDLTTNRIKSIFRNTLQHFVVLVFLCVFVNQSAYSRDSLNIAVLLPESSPAHHRLYQVIIKGMQVHDNVVINQKQFSRQTDTQQLSDWVIEQNSHAVVILGKSGVTLSRKLKLNIPVVTGAHILAPDNHSSVSLAADPVQMFQRLKQLSPSIRRVFVIHNEANTGWLIRVGEKVARQLGLQFEQLEIDSPDDVRPVVTRLHERAEQGRDALWLPLDPAVPTSIVLPNLLKVAWQKELIIFGNNPLDVKKGILFAMYPDYTSMGKQLLAMVQARIKGVDAVRPEASIYLKMAVNNRTASHLGITLAPALLEQINLLYPRR